MAGQRETARELTPEAAPTVAGRAGRGGILAAAGAVAALAVRGVAESDRVAADGQTWNLPYSSGANTSLGPSCT